MSNVKTILETFSSLGRRHTFDLKDGSHYEGYILEVGDIHLVFGGGGPMGSGEDLMIPIDSVDLNTLSFWHEDQKCYIQFSIS
ncbi:hypothetical protein Cal7507_4764 [Calothrix sp. PCC 7507]|nr:hypothetical protein Cal7507_4764 [Calothrix sp. PCC 7507]